MDVGADDVLEKHEAQRARRRERLWQGDESRQRVGHFHTRELGAAAVADHNRKVLAEVRNKRERVAGVERQRREHRADLPREVACQVLSDLRGPVIALDQRDLFSHE